MDFASVFRFFVLAALLGLTPFAGAAGLYTGQASVNSQSDADRAEALKSALGQVVVKLTGDEAVLSRPEVAKAVANAPQYVQQYQYTRDVTTENGQPQTHLVLVAQFDRDAVDKMLADLGVGHAGGGDAAQAAADVQPQSYRVWVSGVHSAQDYAQVVGTLARNDLVHNVQAEQARGDGIELRLDTAGPLSRVLDALSSGPLRVLNAKPPVDGVDALLGLQQP